MRRKALSLGVVGSHSKFPMPGLGRCPLPVPAGVSRPTQPFGPQAPVAPLVFSTLLSPLSPCRRIAVGNARGNVFARMGAQSLQRAAAEQLGTIFSQQAPIEANPAHAEGRRDETRQTLSLVTPPSSITFLVGGIS